MKNDRAWIVDASVAAKWYLRDEEFVEMALKLFQRYAEGVTYLTAPHFIRYELMNALFVAYQQGRISWDEGMGQMADFLALGLHQPGDDDTMLEASIRIASRLGIPAYDALYLALADALGFGFVTADDRLYQRIVDKVAYAHWIGDLVID